MNIEKAKAARYSYYIDPSRNLEVNEKAYVGFEETLDRVFDEWR